MQELDKVRADLSSSRAAAAELDRTVRALHVRVGDAAAAELRSPRRGSYDSVALQSELDRVREQLKLAQQQQQQQQQAQQQQQQQQAHALTDTCTQADDTAATDTQTLHEIIHRQQIELLCSAALLADAAAASGDLARGKCCLREQIHDPSRHFFFA